VDRVRGFIAPVCAVLVTAGVAAAEAADTRPGPAAPAVSATGVAAAAAVTDPGLVVPPAAAAVTYAPPVTPVRVLRGFEPPTSPYGPGHRGVDLGLAQGGLVTAAADGVVGFSGPVAGRRLVVVVHADGISTEYEPVTPMVLSRASVRRGQPVGRLSGLHAGCAPASCLHWGARRGSAYVDPLSLLRPLAPVRLLPWPR
jgi:murein DD-endopeptidase MepM/ murein hydrolase activator NlpD